MKTLNSNQTSRIIGGTWKDRYLKQVYKCAQGIERSCDRALRIAARH